MKRGFVSVLWGDFLGRGDLHDRYEKLKEKFNFDFHEIMEKGRVSKAMVRRQKIHRNMKSFCLQPYSKDATIYVFGKENYEVVLKSGLKAVLVHDDPYKYHPVKGIYLHKLDAYRQVMDDFDEVVLLDFDMLQTAPIPADFWEELNKRGPLQASIHRYRHPRIEGRIPKSANALTPAGAFVYIRGKEIAERLWERNQSGDNKWSCEPAMAYVTDELSDGWKDIDHYWENYEPQFYTSKSNPYKSDVVKYPKRNCFMHGHYTRNPKKPKWLRKLESEGGNNI
jgi:hypothetical protein